MSAVPTSISNSDLHMIHDTHHMIWYTAGAVYYKRPAITESCAPLHICFHYREVEVFRSNMLQVLRVLAAFRVYCRQSRYFKYSEV